MKKIAGAHFNHLAVGEGSRRRTGDHQSDVLDVASFLAELAAHMDGPAPARLVCRAPDRHTAEPDHFEPAQRHLTYFVGVLEPFEDHRAVRKHCFEEAITPRHVSLSGAFVAHAPTRAAFTLM
jgi:hypothetical protein